MLEEHMVPWMRNWCGWMGEQETESLHAWLNNYTENAYNNMRDRLRVVLLANCS